MNLTILMMDVAVCDHPFKEESHFIGVFDNQDELTSAKNRAEEANSRRRIVFKEIYTELNKVHNLPKPLTLQQRILMQAIVGGKW